MMEFFLAITSDGNFSRDGIRSCGTLAGKFFHLWFSYSNVLVELKLELKNRIMEFFSVAGLFPITGKNSVGFFSPHPASFKLFCWVN